MLEEREENTSNVEMRKYGLARCPVMERKETKNKERQYIGKNKIVQKTKQ